MQNKLEDLDLSGKPLILTFGAGETSIALIQKDLSQNLKKQKS